MKIQKPIPVKPDTGHYICYKDYTSSSAIQMFTSSADPVKSFPGNEHVHTTYSFMDAEPIDNDQDVPE